MEAQKPTNCHLTPRTRRDIPPSPLRLASGVSSEAKIEYFVNSVDFEKRNQCHIPIKATSAIPFHIEIGTLSDRALLHCSAVTSLPTAQDNLDGIAYPLDQVQCIDPIYSSDVHNIIDIRSLGAPPLTHITIDPCWTRQPLVLLVEDDETYRRIGDILLRSLQCRIDSASDGLEAVTKFHAGLRYDLVLMDIIMPNQDGISVTHSVRQTDSTPIIAMTSNVSCEHVAMCFQHGRSHSSRYHLASLKLSRNERSYIEAFYERGLV
jgi:osomolarity two-component system response regulator SKN7